MKMTKIVQWKAVVIASQLTCWTVVGLAANPQVTFEPVAEQVESCDFMEVAVKVAGSGAANPFTGAMVEGAFGLAGEEGRKADGFCDSPDGTLHRIRFMPSKPGMYEYTIKYREEGFEKAYQGKFEAVESRRKGVLRVDPEFPSQFQWDGTKERYFWNGTTTYWMAGLDDKAIQESIDRLDKYKVTRVRVALNGRVKDGSAWFEEVKPSDTFSFLLNPWVATNPDNLEQPGFDVTRFNVAYWQKFERLLQHARNKEMVVSVIFYVDGSRPGVDPFGKAGMGGEDEQRYYRYALARFAPFSNVMWDLANEYRLFRDDAWAEKMGAFVKQNDPYHHLTSTHGHGDFRFRTSPWADFAMYQSWDESGGYDFMMKNREEQLKSGRMIPQVNEEYGYEDHYPQGWGDNRVAPARSADSRRRLAWEIYMAGGHQTTGERANSPSGGGWINGRGDDSMVMLEGYAAIYDLFTSVAFWKLVPEPGLVTSFAPTKAGAKARALASKNAEGDLAVVYIPQGGVVSLKVESLRDGLKPMWFSPRNGGMKMAKALRPKTYRTPTDSDWVLILRTPCNCSFREYDEEYEK
jgi:hypothetical protein